MGGAGDETGGIVGGAFAVAFTLVGALVFIIAVAAVVVVGC